MSKQKYGRLLNQLQRALTDKKASAELVESIKRKISKIEMGKGDKK